MITVSTADPAEARSVIGLLRTWPGSPPWEVYLSGARVARQSPVPGEPEVADPRQWPGEPELR